MRLLGLLAFMAIFTPLPAARADEVERVDAVVAEWRADPSRPQSHFAGLLAAIGRPALPTLCRHLDGAHDGLPVAALAEALGRIGDPAALPSLILLLRSPSDSAGEAAVTGLRLLGGSSVLEPLLEAVGREGGRTTAAATRALLELLPSAGAREASRRVFEHLCRSPRAPRYAALLGRLGDPEAHAHLLALLDDLSPDRKIAGLSGLWYSATAEDGPRLLDLCRGDWVDPDVAKQAVLLLGRLRWLPAVPVLIPLLDSGNRGIAGNALWALRSISGLKLVAEPHLWSKWWELIGRPLAEGDDKEG